MTEIQYPDWVINRLTPEHETTKLINPGNVELWLDPRQKKSLYPRRIEVYKAVQEKGLLTRSLSYGHLRWLEDNLDEIPLEFKGKLIYGWASVVRNSDGFLRVPCLSCGTVRSSVNWYTVDDGRFFYPWYRYEPAGLHKK